MPEGIGAARLPRRRAAHCALPGGSCWVAGRCTLARVGVWPDPPSQRLARDRHSCLLGNAWQIVTATVTESVKRWAMSAISVELFIRNAKVACGSLVVSMQVAGANLPEDFAKQFSNAVKVGPFVRATRFQVAWCGRSASSVSLANPHGGRPCVPREVGVPFTHALLARCRRHAGRPHHGRYPVGVGDGWQRDREQYWPDGGQGDGVHAVVLRCPVFVFCRRRRHQDPATRARTCAGK